MRVEVVGHVEFEGGARGGGASVGGGVGLVGGGKGLGMENGEGGGRWRRWAEEGMRGIL